MRIDGPRSSQESVDNSNTSDFNEPLSDSSSLAIEQSPPGNSSSQLTRREILAGLATATSIVTSGCLNILWGGEDSFEEEPGQGAGRPIQFISERHRVTPSMASQSVDSQEGLRDAVSDPNAVIWIPGEVTIDITDFKNVRVASGVTIASDRNLDSGTGALLKCNRTTAPSCFNAPDPVRITGLRLEGPITEYINPPLAGVNYHYGVAAFWLHGSTAIVDHCELTGWPNSGVLLGGKEAATQGWIHHNQIHHNQVNHLGYGVELYNGLHLLEWNYFDWNRHAITGFARPLNGYEARFNIVGPHAILFAFDMHHLGENVDKYKGTEKGKTAGLYCNIHHNLFTLTDHNAFSIQGKPKQLTRFVNNWCPSESQMKVPLVTTRYDDKIVVTNNHRGEGALEQGRRWLSDAIEVVAPELEQDNTGNSSSADAPTSGNKAWFAPPYPSNKPWTPPKSLSESTGTPPSSSEALPALLSSGAITTLVSNTIEHDPITGVALTLQ